MRRSGWWVLAGVALLVTAVSWMTLEARNTGGFLEHHPTYGTWSSNPGGTRALYLALEEAGLRPRRVQVDWTRLPEGLEVLVVPPPLAEPTEEEWQAMGEWVRGGGRLVFMPAEGYPVGPGLDPAFTDLPVGGEGLLDGVRTLHLYRDEVVREEPVGDLFEGHVTLAADGDRTVLTYGRHGDGEVVVLYDPEVLSNGAILKGDGLRLAMNLVSAGSVGFDEYHLGHGTGPDSLWTVSPPQVRAGLLHFTVGLALLLFAVSRRVAEPRPDGRPKRDRSEYLESMATLLRKAGATSLAVRMRSHAFDLAVARALHLHPGAPLPERTVAAEAVCPGAGAALEELVKAMEHLSSGRRPSVEEVLALARRERDLVERLRRSA